MSRILQIIHVNRILTWEKLAHNCVMWIIGYQWRINKLKSHLQSCHRIPKGSMPGTIILPLKITLWMLYGLLLSKPYQSSYVGKDIAFLSIQPFDENFKWPERETFMSQKGHSWCQRLYAHVLVIAYWTDWLNARRHEYPPLYIL